MWANNPARIGRDREILPDRDIFKERHSGVKGHSKFRKWQDMLGMVNRMGWVGG